MLIDDNEADNFYHKHVLEQSRAAKSILVMEAADHALDFFKKHPETEIDLVFLDINMPRMDGFEFLEKYRELKKGDTGASIFIMLTTSMDPKDRKRATELDAKGFIDKPLTTELINTILNEHF